MKMFHMLCVLSILSCSLAFTVGAEEIRGSSSHIHGWNGAYFFFHNTGDAYFGNMPDGPFSEIAHANASHIFDTTATMTIPVPMPIYLDGPVAEMEDVLFFCRTASFTAEEEYSGHMSVNFTLTYSGGSDFVYEVLGTSGYVSVTLEVFAFAFKPDDSGTAAMSFGELKSLFEMTR